MPSPTHTAVGRLDERILSEQVRSLYRNTPPGLAATLIASFVVTGILFHVGSTSLSVAVGFLGATVLHVVPRMYLYHRFARIPGPRDWQRWATYFSLGTLAGGLTLGIGSLLLMISARFDMQLLVLLLICAVASGAVSAFGVHLRSFYLFMVPAGVFPASWLLTRGDLVHIALGAIAALWFMALVEQARRTGANFQESVRLRFENVDLVEDLRRQKAAAEEANAAKSRFLAAASHDLRQPVHALSLFVAALRPHPMDAEGRALLDHIDESVKAMGGLFGGLLDISRLDAGVVEINRIPFRVQPILERVCREHAPAAAAKSIRLRVRPTSLALDSDPLLLERILRNIIANAVAYTDRGKILVGCRRGKQVRIQVLDTGRGIPASEQQHVFQEFYQLGNPERDRNKGVGLGLAIVKRLASLLSHPLELVSAPGRGSRFQVIVPRAHSTPATTANPLDATTVATATTSGLILVVDDEPAIQTAMKSLLQNWGYEVIATGTGGEMLERIAAHPEMPRLIVCDYRLREGETGVDVIEALRSEYNEEIPGMLITGDTAPDRLREAQDSGFLLLHKPVPNSRLRAAITHLILHKSPQELTPAAVSAPD